MALVLSLPAPCTLLTRAPDKRPVLPALDGAWKWASPAVTRVQTAGVSRSSSVGGLVAAQQPLSALCSGPTLSSLACPVSVSARAADRQGESLLPFKGLNVLHLLNLMK